MHFNPRPPRGGRPLPRHKGQKPQKFQSTPPARGATPAESYIIPETDISIHAPREGGDSIAATPVSAHENFNPRPPRGGRLSSDIVKIPASGFQSTPPARGATSYRYTNQLDNPISIHAPREGGDRESKDNNSIPKDFNPRPPRGGRQQRCTVLPADL